MHTTVAATSTSRRVTTMTQDHESCADLSSTLQPHPTTLRAVHAERPFFPGLIKFVTSGPVVCMAWRGKDAISVARNLIGPTNGREAPPGTIRGDYGMDIGYNMIHGSDGEDTAEFELNLWFLSLIHI